MFDDKEGPKMDNIWLDGAFSAIKVLSMVYDIITYPVYLLLQKPWEKKSLSRRVKAKPIQIDDNSVTYRNVDSPGDHHLALIREGVETMDQMLRYCCKRYGEKKCLGTRRILDEEDELQPNGRVFKKYVMGEYKWQTFTDVDKLATSFGSGLRTLGQQPKKPVVIFAETRAEWMAAAHACFKQNIPVVTIYATLGEEAIAHGINETEVSLVITSHDLLPKLKNVLPTTPKVKTIVYMEDQLLKADISSLKNVEVLTFNQVATKGEKANVDANPPKADDIAIIMYTSGSTGVPKGVLLSHSNMLATIKAFTDAVEVASDDIFMGYLPLAHVFELLTESVCFLCGVSIGYSTPLTMIDTASKIKKGSKGDASVLHPTIMTAVPLILDRIYKGVNDKVAKGGPLKRQLFNFAYDYKVKWTRRGFETPLINKFIFGQTRSLLGGSVRLILSGGAPLSPDTHLLIKTCLSLQVTQGYGLTETTSSATVMDRNDMTTGRVGCPVVGCDIRLVDWEEGNYRVRDKPFPRGEIVIGGPNVSQGYFKLGDKTKEDFFDESGKRWFKTGDIGEFQEDGSIKIIDRKKDLVKLQAGEYVSLGKVESELKTCPIVENICVYGDSSKHFCVALVVPNEKQLTDLLPSSDKRTFEQLCQDPKLEKAVLKELEQHAKKCKLEKFEVPAAVKLVSEVWSPDMGLVTAAFKLKRKDIQARYQHEINRMYAS